MFKKIFKKSTGNNNNNNEYVLITALLIHAAKMDEKYTNIEKELIKKAISSLFNIDKEKSDKILILSEEKEKESNQILEFTREIKKNDINYRIKVIEILWKIIYSDGNADMFETNLMRRICGLLYVSDRESGEIKKKIQNQLHKKL